MRRQPRATRRSAWSRPMIGCGSSARAGRAAAAEAARLGRVGRAARPVVDVLAHHLDARPPHGPHLVGLERRQADDRAGGDGTPEVGERPIAAHVVHEDRELALGELVGEVVEHRLDDRSHRPVGQHAEHEVAASAAQRARRRRRGVAQALGGLEHAPAGRLRDRRAGSAVQHVAHGRAGHPALARDVRARHPAHGTSESSPACTLVGRAPGTRARGIRHTTGGVREVTAPGG